MDDVNQAYRIFVDAWRLYRKYSNPDPAAVNDDYWRRVAEDVDCISRRYTDMTLCSHILVAVICSLEDSQKRR